MCPIFEWYGYLIPVLSKIDHLSVYLIPGFGSPLYVIRSWLINYVLDLRSTEKKPEPSQFSRYVKEIFSIEYKITTVFTSWVNLKWNISSLLESVFTFVFSNFDSHFGSPSTNFLKFLFHFFVWGSPDTGHKIRLSRHWPQFKFPISNFKFPIYDFYFPILGF
jgi:hypothetical protein